MFMERSRVVCLCLAICSAAALLPACHGGGGTSVNGGGSSNSATLSWIAPTTQADGTTPLTELTGYRVHYGTASGNYTSVIDAGNVATCVVSNLTPGTYYFAVTAYNSSGDSDYSTEGSKAIQ
jgi:hypothetical protein